MREQITADVLASTRGSAAADAGGLTDAGGRLQISGDVRLRAEAIRQGSDNSPASTYSAGQPALTRAADLWADPNANTRQGLERTRLRARLGFQVAVTDQVAAGISLSTGGVTGPTSTNQTMATGSSQSRQGGVVLPLKRLMVRASADNGHGDLDLAVSPRLWACRD